MLHSVRSCKDLERVRKPDYEGQPPRERRVLVQRETERGIPRNPFITPLACQTRP